MLRTVNVKEIMVRVRGMRLAIMERGRILVDVCTRIRDKRIKVNLE